MFSLSQEVLPVLHPEGSPCSNYDGGSLCFSVTINQTCPPGFNISESARSCICEPSLAQYTNQCNITNGLGQVTCDSSQHFWVGFNTPSHELILHPYCPFDFCANNAKVFPLNNTDVQCTYNRSGFLWGRCKEGYGLVVGTHQCRKCTNFHLFFVAHLFCTDGSITSLLAPCLQIDSGNRNTQWPDILCQYCWSQSYHFFTGEIYWCFISLYCMAKPLLWYWDMPQNLQTLISLVNLGLKTCYSLLTAASDLFTPEFVFLKISIFTSSNSFPA